MIKLVYTYKRGNDKTTKTTRIMYTREYIPFIKAMKSIISTSAVYEQIHGEWVKRPAFWFPTV